MIIASHMVINIILGISVIILSISVISLAIKVSKLSGILEDTISRNRVQHDNIEKELHYIHRHYLKLHLNSAYGKTAEKINNYFEQDIQALEELYHSGETHANINSIRTGNKGDNNDNSNP